MADPSLSDPEASVANDTTTDGASPRDGEVVVRQPERSSAAMLVKRAVQTCFKIWVWRRVLSYKLMRKLLGEERAFMSASESIANGGGFWGLYCRQAFYGQVLEECGQDVYIGWHTIFSMRQARLGEGCYIGHRCGLGYAHIGPKVMLADGVQVLSGGNEHGTTAEEDESHQDQPQTYNQVHIGEGAWIGTNAIIMADVGAHAVIGAGAVVTRPIPPYSVAVGAPARVIKDLRADATAERA